MVIDAIFDNPLRMPCHKPTMSAIEVKELIVAELNKAEADFVCLNFANGDMVGHTGIYDAIVEAVKTVDNCIKEVAATAVKNGYSVMIISDHGNADHFNVFRHEKERKFHPRIFCVIPADQFAFGLRQIKRTAVKLCDCTYKNY